MQNYNLIILVISCYEEQYQMLEKAIRDTWGNHINKEVNILYCYTENRQKTAQIGDNIFCNSGAEYLMNIGSKTISALEFIEKNFEYNFVFRTNLSSYVDVDMLNEISKQYISNKKLIKGVIGNYYGIRFTSGSGYLISRDNVQEIINNQHLWNHNYIDDVSLGILMNTLGADFVSGERFDVTNDTHAIPTNYYHYRVKNEGNRKIDVLRLKKIHTLKNK